jgi:hydroxymethylglutaryl-CoA synthase
MDRPAGISDVVISVPRLYVPIANREDPKRPTKFSLSRNTDPEKYLYGIGVAKMSIPDTYQDPVTLAANSIYELMERNDIKPKDINRIEIGTESSPDKSKSITTYVIGALEKKFGKGSLKRCASPEGKSACAYTAFALENALDWVWSGRSNGNCRIICATDIARYDLMNPGEPTQGAASAAVLVGSNPKLLEFDKIIGQYTEDEGSFYRPNHSHTARVNGKDSEIKYLTGMKEAFDHYYDQATQYGLVNLKPGEALTDHFDLISFHQPFPKMVENAFASLLIHEYRKLPRWDIVVKEIGDEPKRAEIGEKEFQEKSKEFIKRFKKTKTFQNAFDSKVAGGKEFSVESGNSYTASAWGHLVSLLSSKHAVDLTGKKGAIGFFGSGLSASGQSYTVLPGYENVVRSFNLMEKLKNRTAISLQDYEDLHENRLLSRNRKFVLAPHNEFVLTNIENDYRHYDFVD